jgi:hypothetical protein
MQVRRHVPVIYSGALRLGAVGIVAEPMVNPMDDQPGMCALCAHPFEVGEVVEWTHDTAGVLWVHARDIIRDSRD